MKHSNYLYQLAALSGLAITWLLLISSNADVNRTVVIHNVTVIPMTAEGKLLAHHSVIIRDGKITEVVPAAKIKNIPGAEMVDGAGKFLIPGLADMHAHFFYEQGDNINTTEQELKLLLANGVTTARVMCGDSVYLHAREQQKNGKWIGPQLLVVSPQFVGKWAWPGKVFAAVVTNAAEAEAAVKRFKQEGYDAIKFTFWVGTEAYDAAVKTAARLHIPVTGHVGPRVGLAHALATPLQVEHMDEFIEQLLPDTTFNHGQSVSDMGVWKPANWETVDHLDESRIPALVQRVKAAGIYVTPTNHFFVSCFGKGQSEAEIKSDPSYSYIPERLLKERWDIRDHYLKRAFTEERRKKYVHLRNRMVYELWKGGVKLMAGSDSPEWFLVQGFALHKELRALHDAGMSNYAVLETATKNPAAYLGTNTGSIEPGKQADLLLLDKNPLQHIEATTQIRAVFQNGQVFARAQLDGLLEEARRNLQSTNK